MDFNSKARKRKTEINYFFRFQSAIRFECLIGWFLRDSLEMFQRFALFSSGWYACLFDKVLMDFKQER